jgi:hypothetical protein
MVSGEDKLPGFDFVNRSERLLAAAQQFRDSLGKGEQDQELAIDDLLAAAGEGAGPATYGYAGDSVAPQGATARPLAPEEVMSAILVDIQSGNLLISAGLALHEAGIVADGSHLDEAVQHISSIQASFMQPAAAPLGFAAASGIKSATLGAAKETFRTNCESALKGIIDDAATTIGGVAERLRHVDPAAISNGFGKLGEPVQIVTSVGRLIKRGVEKLKCAIEAIMLAFGKDALVKVKEKIVEIWESFKSGKFTRQILVHLFSVAAVEAHIEQKLKQANDLDQVDHGSNALAPLAEDFTRNIKILEAITVGIGLAAGLLAFLHVAGPWLTLVIVLGYLGVVGGAVLIGSEYTGEHRILGWTTGVKQIADMIAAR